MLQKPKQSLKKLLKVTTLRLVAGFMVLALVALPLPSAAIENGGIGGRPANPRPDNPRSESIFIYTLTPGATTEDGINVINNTTVPKTLLVYATDGSDSADKTFACKQFDEERKAVGSWINLAQSEVTIQPGETQLVPFTVTMPAVVGPGEHNGCIAIQEQPAPNEKPGVRLSLRSAIRVAITVPGDLKRELDIISVGHTVRENGGHLATTEIRNTGNVSSDTDVEVSVTMPFGYVFKKFGGNYAIFAGETAKYSFDLGQPFWGGIFKTRAQATYDRPTNADGTQSTKQTVSKESSYYIIAPTLLGGAIELAVLALLIFLLWWLISRRRTRKAVQRSWVVYKVRKGESVHSIANDHQTSWKTLARANRLKAPYDVRTGDTLRVPPKPTTPAKSRRA